MGANLTVFPELEQRSAEWYEQRRGMVTASAVSRLVTARTLKPANNDESRGLCAVLATERITGWVEPTRLTPDMWRGVEVEPIARQTYGDHYAPVTEVGFMVLQHDGWRLGFSPDGLVGDDGLLEVKAPRAHTHLRTILADEVPAQYMPQLQTGLLVSGRDWLDFCSFYGGLPLYTKRVYPDPRWQEAIIAATVRAEDNITALVADYQARVVGLPTTERILTDLDMVI